MKNIPPKFILAALALFHFTIPFAGAITVGTVDTFTGSLDNWQKGLQNPTYLSVVPDGGPAGAGDSYMQSVADGAGSFSRLTVFNVSQWDSNYITDGVTSIRMDLLNSGSSALQIRLGLRDGAGRELGYISSTPYVLGVGTGWQTAEFLVTEEALTKVGQIDNFSSFLSSGFALRILHATSTASLSGNPVVGTLGVDNVTAVPEPRAIALLLVGVAILALKKHRQG